MRCQNLGKGNMASEIKLYNMDCMTAMKEMKDKQFDLAIVDPPYGLGRDGQREDIKNGFKGYKFKEWDSHPPNFMYFLELSRVSKNQIIWGANHFISNIDNKNSSCWLVWDKCQRDFSFADGEMAWTSFDSSLRIFSFSRGSALAENNKRGGHSTQHRNLLLFINGY